MGKMEYISSLGDLSKKYLDMFFIQSAKRLKDLLTFPVETVNMHTVNGKYADEEMADFCCQMWADGASFFM